MINTKTMTSEMIQDQGDNPYKSVVLNSVYKVPEKCPEMKNWFHTGWDSSVGRAVDLHATGPRFNTHS